MDMGRGSKSLQAETTAVGLSGAVFFTIVLLAPKTALLLTLVLLQYICIILKMSNAEESSQGAATKSCGDDQTAEGAMAKNGLLGAG